MSQESAEATFKKIEDALKKADTIKVVMSATAELTSQGRSMKASLDGTLLLKGSDKVKVIMKVKEGDEEPAELGMTASGGKTKGPGRATGTTPATFRDELVAMLPRLGSAVAMQTAMNVGAGRQEHSKPEASNFALKGVEKGIGAMTLDVAFDGHTWNTTLEFEEKTHKLLKVTTQVVPKDPSSPGKAGTGRTITETLKVELGGEIADKEFETADAK